MLTLRQCEQALRHDGFHRSGHGWWRPGDDQEAVVFPASRGGWRVLYLND